MAREREVLSPPDAAGKVGVVNAILNGAAAGGMRTRCWRLFVDFRGARDANGLLRIIASKLGKQGPQRTR